MREISIDHFQWDSFRRILFLDTTASAFQKPTGVLFISQLRDRSLINIAGKRHTITFKYLDRFSEIGRNQNLYGLKYIVVSESVSFAWNSAEANAIMSTTAEFLVEER